MNPGLDCAVEVENVTHRYGERVALSCVSFDVSAGEVFGLLGPNGGGKSTLFSILATLQLPSEGRARVDGCDVRDSPEDVRRRLGVVFQHPSLDELLTVDENLRAQAALYGLSGDGIGRRIDGLLERLNLTARRGERVARLSGGLARRVEIAKGLLPEPRVLLLDEPSAGLDPVARRDLMALLREIHGIGGVTILLTTHHMEEAERCDRIGVLDQGRLVALDTPARLKAEVGGDVVTIRAQRPDVLEQALRTSFGVTPERVDGALCFEVECAHEVVHAVVEQFSGDVEAVSFGKPTLEDAFFHLTGHRLTAGDAEADE